MSKTKFYNTYGRIYQRTHNKNNPAYTDYGGRGIKCLWRNFEEFKNDMLGSFLDHVKKYGKENTTIDRIDNDGNYCQKNCRWTTMRVQSNNRRSNVFIEYKNKKLTLAQWEKTLGLPNNILCQRINKYKWPIEKAIMTPSRR